MRRTLAMVIALLVLGVGQARGQGAEPYATDLSFPTNMAFTPDGRLFFTEKETGLVRIVETGGRLRPEPFVALDVSGGGETGLLGIEVDPAFEDERWIYLYLTDAGTGMNTIVRVRADGETGGEPETLLETVPGANAYHNGGDLLFGADGMLYASVGEAHESRRAQDLTDLGGKILRLTSAGAPAPGNPFGDDSPVYTFGHRNSFGLCQDPATEAIWETENGPDRDDEINRLEPGANYGWPAVTGADGEGTFVEPVAVFGRTIAITGCAWWEGELYAGSYSDGIVRRIDPPTGDAETFARFGAGVTDLQVGPDGSLYVATENAIWRLPVGSTATDGPGPPIEGFDPGGPTARTWIALGAAAVLGVALIARLVAGRRLREEER